LELSPVKNRYSQLSDVDLNRGAAAKFKIRDPRSPLPFCQSLDACRLLEDELWDRELWSEYMIALEPLVGQSDYNAMRATPRQRVEAALIAIEKGPR
jgi:hypothetical protein